MITEWIFEKWYEEKVIEKWYTFTDAIPDAGLKMYKRNVMRKIQIKMIYGF